MQRGIHANVNDETSLVECLLEIEERSAKHEEFWLIVKTDKAFYLIKLNKIKL